MSSAFSRHHCSSSSALTSPSLISSTRSPSGTGPSRRRDLLAAARRSAGLCVGPSRIIAFPPQLLLSMMKTNLREPSGALTSCVGRAIDVGAAASWSDHRVGKPVSRPAGSAYEPRRRQHIASQPRRRRDPCCLRRRGHDGRDALNNLRRRGPPNYRTPPRPGLNHVTTRDARQRPRGRASSLYCLEGARPSNRSAADARAAAKARARTAEHGFTARIAVRK